MSDNEFGTSYRGSRDEEEIASPVGGPPQQAALLPRDAPGSTAERFAGAMAVRVNPSLGSAPGKPEGDPPPILRGITGSAAPPSKIDVA